jgi:hypothetical protein
MRFYFDVHISGKMYPDPVGRDFARSEDARDFAVNIACDFIRSTNQNPHKVARAIIEVTNRRDISMAVRMFDIYGLCSRQRPQHEKQHA